VSACFSTFVLTLASLQLFGQSRSIVGSLWLGSLLQQVCMFPRGLAHRIEALDVDSLRFGVQIAHLVRQSTPDTDADESEHAWLDHTQFAHNVLDRRVLQLRALLNTCIERHGRTAVVRDDDDAAPLRQLVHRWIEARRAASASASMSSSAHAAHLDEWGTAQRYNEAAQQRRLAAALAAPPSSAGVTTPLPPVDNESIATACHVVSSLHSTMPCDTFIPLLASSSLLATNRKKRISTS
jgi:hypothetical protein